MKKIIILIFFFQTLNYSQEIFRGDLLISNLSAECIDTTYITNPLSNSIPSNSTYKINKLVYEVILTIRLFGNDFTYTKPLALTFNTPDNNSTTVIINQELYDFFVGESYEFLLNVQSENKGWTNIEINEWDMYNLAIVKNNNINFINNSIYLE